ncbi:TonB-dependent receptor plug domain-containing protein [Caulobacter soli]|uniref:TonB-dependent receptor plug domain-containing protein n=1 Tax=Caulobacter soli TaxID=2708539 RepID=UPI0013EB6508|nr:TonB-dependent receptor [Caulobacter soli]
MLAERLNLTLLAAASSLALVAHAQAAEPASPAAVAAAPGDATEVESLVVTLGVRGAQRTVADSPAPIDIISGKQLAETGRADLKEALAQLLPSFTYSTVTGVAHNTIFRPLTNRGLSGAYTLVLVNGKRRHNSAMLSSSAQDNSGANPVDLDLIAISAVDHIEVLKDGAAAQYGSDAIAGVINVVLKSSASGGGAYVSLGGLYAGDGAVGKIGIDHGFALGTNGGFVHLSLDARSQQRATWNNPATGTLYFPLPGGAPDPREAGWDHVGQLNGNPKLNAANAALNAQLPLGEVTAYAQATASVRQAAMYNFLRRPNTVNDIPSIFPDGFFPILNIDETDYQVVLGGRGTVAGWDYDLSTAFSRDRVKGSSDLTLNPSLGPTGPTSFDKLYVNRFTQWTNNLDLTRAVDLGLRAPLQVSFGAEHRFEEYEIEAGELAATANGGYRFSTGPLAGQYASIGAQAVTTASPEDAGKVNRDSVAAYVETSLDVSDKLFLGAAGRAEHYDDSAGDTLSGKLTARYDFTPAFAFRGTISNGFRAPSLPQLIYSQTDNRVQAASDGTPVTTKVKVARVNSPLALALGSEPLKPEKSVNYSLGFTFTQGPVTLTADAYQIAIKDRITKTSSLYGPAVSALLVSQGFDGNQWVQYYTNAIDTRTRGLDVVADYRQSLADLGSVRWTLGFAWNKTKITDIAANPSELANLGPNAGGNLVRFSRSAQGNLTDAFPKTKLALGADWSRGPFSVTLRITRYGKVATIADLPTGDRWFGAKWITDLALSADLTPKLKLTVGAENLLDVRPSPNAIPDSAGSALYGSAPFSPQGGFYYSRLSYSF